MRNGRGLLSATKTYTESLFNEKAGEESSLFLLFLFFFFFLSFFLFLLLSLFYRPDNAYLAVDAWLRFHMRPYDTGLQMKAAQMQFAFAFALNTSELLYGL
jgi:hypothetical protein